MKVRVYGEDKAGLVADTTVIQITCPHCNSDLDVTFSDISRCAGFRHDVDACGVRTCCGACNQYFLISQDKMPKNWLKALFPPDEF
ncbi:MAG: hypothetical protein WC310_02820 [Patescibacteria group bacterium]|jgi:hypothetical protein